MAVVEAGTGGRWVGKSMRTVIRVTLMARLSCWQSSPWELSYDEQVSICQCGEHSIQFIAKIGLAFYWPSYPMLNCCEDVVGTKSTKCTENTMSSFRRLFC
jgi:hypothetical protein